MFILRMKTNFYFIFFFLVSLLFCSVSFSHLWFVDERSAFTFWFSKSLHLLFECMPCRSCDILSPCGHYNRSFVIHYKNVYACNKCQKDSIQFVSSFDWKLQNSIEKKNARRKATKKTCSIQHYLERLEKWAMFMLMIIHDKRRSLHISHIECLMLIHFHIKHENSQIPMENICFCWMRLWILRKGILNADLHIIEENKSYSMSNRWMLL